MNLQYLPSENDDFQGQVESKLRLEASLKSELEYNCTGSTRELHFNGLQVRLKYT